MVVGLHAGFLGDITELGRYLTRNGIFRIAVPIFLLINGFYFYTVLNKGNALHWFKRVMQLYLFWMLVYVYFWFDSTGVFFTDFVKTVHVLLVGYLHLWYFPAMMGAAFLVVLVHKLSLKLLLTMILITFVVGVSIQYIGKYHMVDNTFIDMLFNKARLYRNFLLFAFPFFLTGFLINKFKIQEKISFRQVMLWGIIGIVLLSAESYFNYRYLPIDNGIDMLIALLLVTPAIFLLFMKLDLQGKSKLLSFYATGIYLVHPLLLTFYERFTHFGGTALTFVVIVSSIVASYFLIKINHKIRFIL